MSLSNPFGRLKGDTTPAPEKKVPYEEVGGAFSCQTCNAVVREARYYNVQKALLWDCPEGHRSFIEDFNL